MPISADPFRVEDLDPDRLAANLVEIEETIRILDSLLADPNVGKQERAEYEVRRRREDETLTLTKELLRRRRIYDAGQ